MTDKTIYSISCGNWGDGKSVCLWRITPGRAEKIARFQSDEAAKIFAKEYGFPLSDKVKDRLKKVQS